MGSCGDNYSCALTNKGEVYGWGRATPLKAKIQNPTDKVQMLLEAMRPKPLSFQTANKKNAKIIKISCGSTHFTAIDQLGNLFSWGEKFFYNFLKKFDLFKLVWNFVWESTLLTMY